MLFLSVAAVTVNRLNPIVHDVSKAFGNTVLIISTCKANNNSKMKLF